MDQVSSLAERIRSLKIIAASMHEGAIHTQLIPEIDSILALPEDLSGASVGERDAISRQIREYEQTFDRLGYTLLDQIMPTTGESSIFQIVRAAESFKKRLKSNIGKTYPVDGKEVVFDQHAYDTLCRYSLSIGTPPVTESMQAMIHRTIFGQPPAELMKQIETLDCDRIAFAELLELLAGLVDNSMHYCTAQEEQAFSLEAAEFINFEGSRLFNRVVITESPNRVIELIQRHLFDKFAPGELSPVHLVEGIDQLDDKLIERMRATPNQVFVVRVSRIPHRLISRDGRNTDWRSVLGRLILIDYSARARLSNTSIVYTLFPHVAQTLRNIQTCFSGRPANSQMQLRRILERFTPEVLGEIRAALETRLVELEAEGVLIPDVDQIRVREWARCALFDYLALKKLRRIVSYLELIAADGGAPTSRLQGVAANVGRVADYGSTATEAKIEALAERVADEWCDYFYRGLPRDEYKATILPGGGRGALTLVGDYQREKVRRQMESFRDQQLHACRQRLEDLKEVRRIPASSTDEIQAAIRQSELRALSPTQWQTTDEEASRAEHMAKTLFYRAADSAGRLTRRTRHGLDKAAFGNFTGGAAAALKKAMTGRGYSALHGRLEDLVGKQVGRYDRRLRDVLSPFQELVRNAQHSLDQLKGDLDPVAVGEIEAVLDVVEQGHFYPTLILPEMSWSYHDTFPDKYFPSYTTMRIPLNDRYEFDPLRLFERLEEYRYLFRRFPEVFQLLCGSMLLVINTPHNPTGVVYRRETVLRLLQIASEYGITVVDDNSYHKVVSRQQKAKEGDACVAQLYESFRSHFPKPIKIITAGATTKGLQGAGDRTGILLTNDAAVVEFVKERASHSHQLSLYLTTLKLESGLAAKRFTREVEKLAGDLLDPTATVAPWNVIREHLQSLMGDLEERDFPVAVFETLLDGYERLLRLKHRDASVRELSECLSQLVQALKGLRIERRLRNDVQQRLDQVRLARLRALPDLPAITPQGAFYACIRLTDEGDDRGIEPFLRALSLYRKADLTYAGKGFIRLSLGGFLQGDRSSYDRLGQAVEIYLQLLDKYWRKYDAAGRDPSGLAGLFLADSGEEMPALLADLQGLIAIHRKPQGGSEALVIQPSERGTVYCIEEGRSVTDKIFVHEGSCQTVDELLSSQAFRVIYRRLLKKVYRQHTALGELSFAEVENQYGPFACKAAYYERQRIDAVFPQLLLQLYQKWHNADTVRVLSVGFAQESHREKIAALNGINRTVNELIRELMHAFTSANAELTESSSFEIGFETLTRIQACPNLPGYLGQMISEGIFAGTTSALNPRPEITTGASKRVADYRYGFSRRDGLATQTSKTAPGLEYFQRRLELFSQRMNSADYVFKAVQVGPFKKLLLIHRSCFHLINDELRLFPQIEEVQNEKNLHGLDWDGLLIFGMPAKTMGDTYKTGYVIDRKRDGTSLPTAWVCREDATDYVGFLKKSLLTLHNERVKEMGGMPVHGAMITITFKNGLRKTLVFSADSGTGKSETITAMMEQMINGMAPASEVDRIDILAGDMLSMWRGEDHQIYAFGTETGDFMRLTDITESWQSRFGDLLEKGSYSNLDHPKNPRVTIPQICDVAKILRPTRVNGFFYINNYGPVTGSSVELSDDPRHVLKQILVRGLRRNKGTSGDQPSLRAGLEFAGETALVTRFRHSIDQLLQWRTVTVQGAEHTCLVYRDGVEDVFAAREVVNAAFRGKELKGKEATRRIVSVEYDILNNLFYLIFASRQRALLDRHHYDQVYAPLVSTFCGNPFVDPTGMDKTLGLFADMMCEAKVHAGVIKTQLARPGHEFDGPAKAAGDIIGFLLEDEEVNARFQRNKGKVHAAMERGYRGVLDTGGNLPVDLEGYNLLLLEAHESTHVAFIDHDEGRFAFRTPYYQFDEKTTALDTAFVAHIALPDAISLIVDICENPDLDLQLDEQQRNLADYDGIHYWNSIEELTYQILLANGVIYLGSSESEIAQYPYEVRKARATAEAICADRAPMIGAQVVRLTAG